MYPDLSMTLWYAGTAVVLLVDIFDIVLDFAMVGELAAKGFRDEAAWLAVMTILAFALSATIRVAGSSNAEPWEVLWFFCLAELAAFFVEDATTVMIWWRTGIYDRYDEATHLNLVFTVISGCIAIAGAASCGLCFDPKESKARLVSVVSLLLGVPFVIFWGVIALNEIANGRWRDDGWRRLTTVLDVIYGYGVVFSVLLGLAGWNVALE